jgi:hypothetical protein
MHSVSQLDEAEIRRGELGLAANCDPVHSLSCSGELKGMHQAPEGREIDSHELEDAKLVFGASGSQWYRVP